MPAVRNNLSHVTPPIKINRLKGEFSRLKYSPLPTRVPRSPKIEDFTIWSHLKKQRVPFKEVSANKQVETLWKVFYYIQNPTITHPVDIDLNYAISLLRLCGDLVDRRRMLNYCGEPEYNDWVNLYFHIVENEYLPVGIKPFTGFPHKAYRRKERLASSSKPGEEQLSNGDNEIGHDGSSDRILQPVVEDLATRVQPPEARELTDSNDQCGANSDITNGINVTTTTRTSTESMPVDYQTANSQMVDQIRDELQNELENRNRNRNQSHNEIETEVERQNQTEIQMERRNQNEAQTDRNDTNDYPSRVEIPKSSRSEAGAEVILTNSNSSTSATNSPAENREEESMQQTRMQTQSDQAQRDQRSVQSQSDQAPQMSQSTARNVNDVDDSDGDINSSITEKAVVLIRMEEKIENKRKLLTILSETINDKRNEVETFDIAILDKQKTFAELTERSQQYQDRLNLLAETIKEDIKNIVAERLSGLGGF